MKAISVGAKTIRSERDSIRVNNDSGKTVFVKEISVEGVFWSSRGRSAKERKIKKRQMRHTLTSLEVFVEDMASLRVLTIFFNHDA